jgi:hypothetical protein
MKIIITEKQMTKLVGEKITCKCGHSWNEKDGGDDPYLCHSCGWDLKRKKYKTDELEEKWSEKYKRSINCNNPKGFSQRAHCQGRKKRK